MRQHIDCTNDTDSDGNPAGGSVWGTGIEIEWQDGPLGRGELRVPPNGAFIEGVIAAAIQRLEFYQAEPKFRCRENAIAITKLEEAMHRLDDRTRSREARGVEGTHEQ
jgi:hypothetical protein